MECNNNKEKKSFRKESHFIIQFVRQWFFFSFRSSCIYLRYVCAASNRKNISIHSVQIGSFFMINLCLVVIATQFSETKKREMERMRQERARYTSNSTLASSTNNSEPATCYAEIVKYIAHLWRRNKRRLIKKLRLYKYDKFSFFYFILSTF